MHESKSMNIKLLNIDVIFKVVRKFEKILLLLKEGKISSGELALKLQMTPQALSYHLTKLKKAELIYETRYKNFIYYELNLSILDEVLIWIDKIRR